MFLVWKSELFQAIWTRVQLPPSPPKKFFKLPIYLKRALNLFKNLSKKIENVWRICSRNLKKNIPLKNVKSGDRGVIVMIYESSPRAYEVEVVSENGDMVALLTLEEDI